MARWLCLAAGSGGRDKQAVRGENRTVHEKPITDMKGYSGQGHKGHAFVGELADSLIYRLLLVMIINTYDQEDEVELSIRLGGQAG